MNPRIPFRINRTAVMGGIAVLLTALTLLDYTAGPGSSKSSGARSPLDDSAAPAGTEPAVGASRAGHVSASRAWQEIRSLSRLRENAAVVADRYRTLAIPYAEMMAEVAVVHGADEKPDAAAKRAIAALLPPTVQIKALLVTDGGLVQQGNTLLSVNLSLESADSLALQQAVTALGNPAAGLVWRELALNADGEKHRIALTGLLSVLAVRYAE